MPDDALGAAADELYALPAGEFTAARNTRAKTAKAAGDRDLAARIAALPRPSTAAWAVNQLARRSGADLERVEEAAAEAHRRPTESGSLRAERSSGLWSVGEGLPEGQGPGNTADGSSSGPLQPRGVFAADSRAQAAQARDLLGA